MLVPLYMATVSAGSYRVSVNWTGIYLWDCVTGLPESDGRVQNVSLRSLCPSFSSCLALTVALNHTRLRQLVLALPKKDRHQRPSAAAL